ncbi:MAG: DUF2281 domain-containing protein [Oscillospiraceae bacterium]|nr:DUF2281 domain-containing protein [Oscillospiraceae bacterium]
MSAKEQLINDIKLLPEHMLQVISVIVKEIAKLNYETEIKQRPVFGSGKGKMWIADDFDAPLEELYEKLY